MISDGASIAPAAAQSGPARLVIVGKNSVLWGRIRERVLELQPTTVAISHREVGSYALAGRDVVWILSYAPDDFANTRLMEKLKAAGAGRACYVSTATANIVDVTTCYGYPAVKAAAERTAREVLNASIVRIGMIYDHAEELPAGRSAATALDDMVRAMIASLDPDAAPDAMLHLYQLIDRPFGSSLERALYSCYGLLLRWTARWPCLLRPIDLILRTVGYRWYGYFRLSNERCTATT